MADDMATKGSTQHAGSASAANILTESNQDAINTNSNAAQAAASRGVRKLVLCFDGTGNKFHGDDSDSNILKIFRMLDRTADDQYHYYQREFPISPLDERSTDMLTKLASWDRDVRRVRLAVPYVRSRTIQQLVRQGQGLGCWLFIRPACRWRVPLPDALL